MRVLYLGRIRIWRCWFLWRKVNQTSNPEKNPRSKARTDEKLNPHMAPGRNRTPAIMAGGERSHLSTIPAPQNCKLVALGDVLYIYIQINVCVNHFF